MPRKLIEDREFRRRLNNISKTGLFRLRNTDPRCPRPTKVMGKNATDEAEADYFIQQLLDDREPPREESVGVPKVGQSAPRPLRPDRGRRGREVDRELEVGAGP